MMIPAIVLSCHTIGLSVARGLGLKGVPVTVLYYEKKDMGYVSKFVKERIYTPHPEKHEDEFMAILLKLAEKYKGAVLIPADDATLTTVSKNKNILTDYYLVACPGWDITEKFIDKKYTYALADSIGIPAPRSLLPSSMDDVEKYAKTVDYPCLVKPCKSHTYFEHFNRKMVKVENKNELIAAYNEAHSSGIEVIIQEYIPGDDTRGANYNSYFVDGKPFIEFTAQKCRLSPPEFGIPRVVKSINIPEVIESGRKIIKALCFNGYSCTEFKKDARDGVYKLMEVNGRHNRSGLLSIKSGINFPLIEYTFLTTNKLPEKCIFKQNIYWIDEFHDVINSIRYLKKENYSFIDYIRPYLEPHIFAVFNFKDPKPFVKRFIDIVKMAF